MTRAPASTVQRAAPWRVALPALAGCVLESARLLARGDLAWPREHVGIRIGFADGTSAVVFRETVRRGAVARDPCVLVVEFRLHWLRGWTHALFRAESICNTPLFAGFPGLVSKLWLAHDQHDVYRGLYEWDGAERAEHYARSLWRVLAIGSVRGSIGYTVIPGARRGDVPSPVAPYRATATCSPATIVPAQPSVAFQSR